MAFEVEVTAHGRCSIALGRDHGQAEDAGQGREHGEHGRRLDVAQQEAAAEAADHRRQHEVRHQLTGGAGVDTQDLRLFKERDQVRDDGDFGADIDEDADRAQDRPLRTEGAERRHGVGDGLRRMCCHRVTNQEDQQGKDGQDGGDTEIDVDDIVQTVSLQRVGDDGARIVKRALEEEGRTELAAQEGAQAVESLRQVQTEVRTLGVAHRRDQRVGGDLQERDARGGDEQADQDGRVGVQEQGRIGDQAAGDDADQADDDRLGVADARQNPGGWDRHDAVGDEEGQLGQVRFEIVEGIDLANGADQRIDQIGYEGPDEKEARDVDDGQKKAPATGLGGYCGVGHIPTC